MSPTETPLALYARLTTGVDPYATPRALGRALEPGLVSYLGDALRVVLLDARRQDRRQGPWLARPDAITVGGDLVMAKIAPWSPAGDWASGPPPWLTAAATWEMGVTGTGRCAAGVYGAGGLWRAVWLGFDPDLWARLTAAATDFQRRVVDRRPPAPGDTDLAAVKAVFDTDGEGEIRLTREHARQWDLLRDRRKRVRALEKKAASLESRLRYAVALHRFGLLPDGRRLRLAVDAGGGRRLVEVGKR